MKHNIPEIQVSFTPLPAQDFQGKSPNLLMQELLKKECQNIKFGGSIIDCLAEGIFLLVEDDIQNLIEEYLYLEALVVKDGSYEHGTGLIDYSLSMTSSSDREMVKLRLEYYPDGTRESFVDYTIDIPENEYLWWWRSLASEILRILRQYSIL
jgi:hypothetical protein